MKLSNESLLLLKNWDAYQDVLSAKEGLENEFAKLLGRLVERLQKQDWWKKNQWYVWRDSIDFVFSDHRWKNGDNHLIVVGVDKFTPDRLLNDSEKPPLLFVYVNGKFPDLYEELRIIIKKGKSFEGELNPSPNDPNIIKKYLNSCLPEEIDLLEETAFNQLAQFCKYYGELFEEFNKVAQKYL